MHASNVALLVLAASAAAPALAAPLLYVLACSAAVMTPADLPIVNSHPNGRSVDGVVSLNGRQSSEEFSNIPTNDMFLNGKTTLTPADFEMTGIEKLPQREDVQLAARDVVDDNVATSARSISEQAMQSRNLFTELADVVGDFLRRDLAPDAPADHLHSRNWFNEILDMAEGILRRDVAPTADRLQSRNWFNEILDMAEGILRRDVTPDGLARRYIGGDVFDEFIDYFTLNMRDLGDDSAFETIARRDDAHDFFNALLGSRDLSNPEGLLSRRDATDDFIKALIQSRDSESSTLEDVISERDATDDFIKALIQSREWSTAEDVLSRRDATDDFIKALIQSRDSESSTPEDVISERDATDDFIKALIQSREWSAPEDVLSRRDTTDDFIKALLQSRDLSTPEGLLSLASRALDDLD